MKDIKLKFICESPESIIWINVFMLGNARDATNSHEVHVSPLKITDPLPAGNPDWVKTEREHLPR